MIHETATCPIHGFKLVSMPRDPQEPTFNGNDRIPGARDNKGFTHKCPLNDCLAGIPSEL